MTPGRARSAPLRLLVSAALVLAVLAACGGPRTGTGAPAAQASATAELDRLPIAELAHRARVEGRVTVYSFTSRITKVEEAFEAAYPGIDLVGHDLSSTQQVERLIAEAQAGVADADVAYLSDAPVVLDELVGRGLLRRYVPPTVAGDLAAEHTEPLLAHRLSTKVLMYNEASYPAGAPVRNSGS